MKGCRLRLHEEGECGAHPEPPLLLMLRRAWRVFLKHVATDKGRKKVPQMEGNHSKAGEVGRVAPGGGDHLKVRGRFPPLWTHRGNHRHRKIKGGKHVDYFVEEQVVTEKR